MWVIKATDTFDQWFSSLDDGTRASVLAVLYREAILLCAGNKRGNEKRFYAEMIPLAEKEYAKHLKNLKTRT